MAVAQSNIGVQIFFYNSTTYKFEYLVPLVGDLPPMGSAPATIECTEMDSSSKQYISDRKDNPAIELNYNYLAEYETKIKQHLNSTTPSVFALILPLSSSFVVESTGDTWLNGGSPILGAFSLIQSKPYTMVSNKDEVLTASEVEALTDLGVKKSADTDLTVTDKFNDIVDWTTIPVGKINYPEA